MARAHNYYRWILGAWLPYLGRVVLELGAGIGTFSAHLIDAPIDRLFLLEPAPSLGRRLEERFRGHPRVRVLQGILEDFRPELRTARVESVVTVNVLEHIPDDRAALRSIRDILVPGGTVLIFVPALPFLYGSMDRTFGHVRRYTKTVLVSMLHDLGYEVLHSRYMNLLGAVSWFLAGRVLRQRTVSPLAVTIADRTLIPLSHQLERWVHPPLGQSVLVAARRL